MMSSSLSKNHTPYEQLCISGRERSVQQNMAKKHLLTLATNYGTLFQMNTLADFKAKIKTWVPENCPCRLCKTYIHQMGFI